MEYETRVFGMMTPFAKAFGVSTNPGQSRTMATRPENLEEKLHSICESQPFVTRFFVKCLKSGQIIEREPQVQQPSASTRKVAIMMTALKAAHEGRLNLDEQILFEEGMEKNVASGTYRYMTPGGTISLRDAITNMVITSDNVCTQMVYSRISLEEVGDFCRRVGMKNTLHKHIFPPADLPPSHAITESNATSAADQGLLLELILRGTHDRHSAALLGCSPELCARALDVLSWQILREMIPALLPFGSRVCCKTGLGKRGRMDVGVAYHDDGPAYILTAYTDDVPEVLPNGLPGYTAAFETIAKLSRACWDATKS